MWNVKSQAEMPSAFDMPQLEAFERIFLAAGAAHFDERRRAADERGPAARVVSRPSRTCP